MTQREQYVKTAQSYVGCKEGDSKHKKLVNTYNSHKPLARGYALKMTDAWCQGFTSAIAVECGMTDVIAMEVGCPKAIELYKKMGCWKEADNYVPKPGDLIYYDWQDSGKGDNVGNPDHVGIVVNVKDGIIKVVEGNINNGCGYRNIAVNARYIRGFAAPKFKDVDPLASYKANIKAKAGLSDSTIEYLADYKYGEDLLKKLSNAMK